MEPKGLLLLNAAGILTISFSTDYWIKFSYRVGHVPSWCQLSTNNQFSTLKCIEESRAIVNQYSNLFHQCNDLTDGYRRNISRSNLLYEDHCIFFIWHRNWRHPACPLLLDLISLLLAVVALGLLLAGLNYVRTSEQTTKAALAICLCTVCYAIAILFSLINIRLINTYRSSSIQIDATIDEWTLAEPGWSLLVGAVGSMMSAVCAYLYMASGKKKRFRQRSMRRRRQMQTAIMSSCQQEVALAIRAKMTVI
ncbi:hypothetical protein AB6A40_000979 [Gnathostoma spinigerum]|uniref:Claudin n=1 Tax=Gnathostoma spinigerum TaxID=75299 RepID=A0ABD6E363_9BILA